MTNAMLDAFGPKLGKAYDIGCGFSTTVKNSPRGKKAAKYDLKWLIGAFHGHAHNRLCQLHFLANYVTGMGLEDMEGCERWFSGSNALGRSTRYASVFHRKQAIRTYTAHHDTFEVYANLSRPESFYHKRAPNIHNRFLHCQQLLAGAGGPRHQARAVRGDGA